MCGRYRIDETADGVLKGWISEAKERADRLGVTMKTEGDMFPSDIVPVIAPGMLHRSLGCYPMRWGFPHPSRRLTVINARSETAPEKAFFAASTEERRCLIPASAYYEWKKEDGEKRRYIFRPASGILLLAGLYIRSSSEILPSFSILTCDASEGVATIHKRMPLIIPEERIDSWLSSDVPYADAVSGSYKNVVYEQG